MTNRTLLALVLAATMVLAGCSGGTGAGTTAPADDTTDAETTVATSTEGTDTTQTTAGGDQQSSVEDCESRSEDDDDIVKESGACLGFDADQVYRNILEMTGNTEMAKGPRVNSKSTAQTVPYSFEDFGFETGTFQTTMGIAPESTPNVYSGGNAGPTASGGVNVNLRYISNQTSDARSPGPTQNATEAEITAAHEFLHAMQFYKGYQNRLARNVSQQDVHQNTRNVFTAQLEGSAVYFEMQYQQRYMDRITEPRSVSRWANQSAFSMYTLGPYVMGNQYTQYRVNSTAEFEKLYDNPAVTMEQVLHNYMPNEELPKPLSVTGDVSSDWSTPSSSSTKGELFLRAALRSELSGPKAAAGATGWGNDGLIEFRNASYNPSGEYKTGYAWGVRLDNETEGAEFETLFGEWLESKGSLQNGVYVAEDGQAYRLVERSEETYVVLAGHETFVTQAVVSGNTTEVVIEHTSEDQTQGDSVEDGEEAVAAGSVSVRPLA